MNNISKNKKKAFPQPQSKPFAGNRNAFTIIITAVFFIAAFVGILHHEMWRDEYQAWMIAKDSHSLLELYRNCIYEGHPMLWHLLLFVITSVFHNIFWMQTFNVLLATASVYLFMRYSNFNLLQKTLFSFGYYSLFEYAVITRYSSLGLLLVIAFCVLYKKRRQNVLWLFTILFLLANTSLLYLALAISLSLFLFLDLIFNYKKSEWEGFNKSHFVLGVIIFFVGIVLSILQIAPENDNYIQVSFSSLGNITWMKAVLSKIYNAYTLIPELKILPDWNLSGRIGLTVEDVGLNLFLSIILGLGASLILLRRPFALLFYWIGTISLVIVYGLTFLLAPRYIGHMFIVLITSLWLAEYLKETDFRNSLLRTFSAWGKKIQNSYLYIILGSQFIAGIAIYMTDINKPFSASKAAANFILEQKLDTLPVVGTKDYVVSPFAALLNKPIYFPERKEAGTFISWDGKRNDNANFGDVIDAIDTVLGENHQQCLLIMNTQPSFMRKDERIFLEHDTLPAAIKIDIQGKFEKSMVPDEVFYIYLAQRIK